MTFRRNRSTGELTLGRTIPEPGISRLLLSPEGDLLYSLSPRFRRDRLRLSVDSLDSPASQIQSLLLSDSDSLTDHGAGHDRVSSDATNLRCIQR